ncbi:hypothetical protein L2E82_31069 [Cichorium intybus]|uniref:Uncharacterized protein n=1 Tax=Cichorium intybus TaxID=13427 RepID=A0ACB9D2A7_CICIN|nr:hypothetical protein L2E82_31069 [Cichorium intybus]
MKRSWWAEDMGQGDQQREAAIGPRTVMQLASIVDEAEPQGSIAGWLMLAGAKSCRGGRTTVLVAVRRLAAVIFPGRRGSDY